MGQNNPIYWLVTCAGVVGTFYFGFRTLRLQEQRRRLTWADLQSGAKDLGRDITRSFKPDVALTLSARGATIAHLVILEIGEHIPLYVGIQEDLLGYRFSGPPRQFDAVDTTKWNNYIPKALYHWAGRRLLIIDDLAMSGDSLLMIRDFLESKGFQPEDMKTATLVCTTTAKSGGKAPDYTWLETQDPKFYFPWGKAR